LGTPIEKTYRQVMEQGIPAQFRTEGQYTSHWYEVNVYPSSEGITIFSVDITDQVNAEQALRESEAALREVHERAKWLAQLPEENPNPVARVSGDGRVLYHNPAAARVPGWNLAENQLLPEPVLPLIEQALAQGQEVQQDVPLANRFYSISIMPFPGEAYANLYGRDITERKKAEADLAGFAKQLERSNRELEQFAFVASHDLQEPLRKIEAFGEALLERAGRLDDRERGYLERMRRAAGRMRGMVDGLLQLSRVTTQAQPFVQVDLSQVASDVLSDLDHQVRRTGGTVEVGDLPVIQGDPLQMHQLLLNLVGNALKFHWPGIPPVVKVSSERLPAAVQIIVEDNGIGFNPEAVDLMFQPFQRLVGRNEYEGSGMGLAICRKIVERHGGEINARSQPGQGAAFTVRLPA
jgi:signal transduction histidine kinase